jgi:hypothetical protein
LAGAKHPSNLRDRGSVVGDRAQRECADDGVERLVGEIERLRVADAQINLAPE